MLKIMELRNTMFVCATVSVGTVESAYYRTITITSVNVPGTTRAHDVKTTVPSNAKTMEFAKVVRFPCHRRRRPRPVTVDVLDSLWVTRAKFPTKIVPMDQNVSTGEIVSRIVEQ